MLSFWLTLRQAREALRAGRPDHAHVLLDPLLADGHRRALRLAGEVARAYVIRGEKALRADNSESAWADLLAAEALNTGDSRAADLRTALTRLGLAECRAALEAGNPVHVVNTIARLRSRQARHPDFDPLESAAQDWVLAAEMADRGDFLLARSTADHVRARLVACPPTGFDKFAQSLAQRHEVFRTAVGRLTDAAESRCWREAALHAGEVIAVAPTHRDARTLQMRAWASLQPNSTTSYHGPETFESSIVPLAAALAVTKSYGPSPEPAGERLPTLAGGTLPKRFLLWIDGVGGYLVCLAPRVTFGQAATDGPIDVPLLADVSRLHAEISRDGEGYVLESARGVQINGVAATRSVLRPGDRVTLGSTCQFVFHQPVPISPTARLELVSGHRLQVAVDGVLLMAENLILGPAGQGHITIPWLTGTVVLYRSKDGLGVRVPGEFRIDQTAVLNRALLPLPACVTMDALSFAVEPVGARL